MYRFIIAQRTKSYEKFVGFCHHKNGDFYLFGFILIHVSDFGVGLV